MTTDSDATTAFSQLPLPPLLLQAVEELGFENCTEIQALTLPAIAEGHDIAAQAQTGTGKTAAFLLGSFARLLENDGGERQQNQPRMLVLAPTRELAIQIKKDADALGKHTGLKSMVAYGGVDYEKQRKELADGVDIVIGTPGRLIDYFKQKVFNLKRLEICVLDEADRMFDLGFIADIRFLLRRMPEPENRTSMLFSATLSHRVMELAYEHMNNPVAIKTEARNVTADGVRQALYHPASDEKIPLLLGLIQSKKPERAIVFVNTKRVAEKVDAYLTGNGVACGTLSGDVRQKKRQKILNEFTSGNLSALIATDVAARGLHIDDVTHVFNYDLPQHAEDYVHRIGRTARAGTQGEAVSFVCEEYAFSLPEIQEYIGQSIPTEAITDEMLVEPQKPVWGDRSDRVQPRNGKGAGPGGRGGRRSGGGGRHRGGSKPRSRHQGSNSSPDASATGPASATASATASSSTGGAPPHADANTTTAPKKRRRRRRKPKPAGDKPAGESS